MAANLNDISPLVNHLLAQKSLKNMEKVLRQLLTSSELTEVKNRLQIIEMLEQGMPQRQIADKLGVGIATVTRGSTILKQSKRL